MNPVEEIKNRLDIVEVISAYIPLNPAGGNLRAICPFHNEKTPSFMVSKEKQIWHCFGCDKGGDLISFVQEYEGIDFKEAIKILAQKANVPLQGFSLAKKEDYQELYRINEVAMEFYFSALEQDNLTSQKTKEYLGSRQVSPESIAKWKLGLAGEDWDGLFKFLLAKGYKEQDIFQAGLSVKKKDASGYVDRFRKRLIFPLFDSQGRVVAFTSRTLAGIVYDQDDFGGKYINSPQSHIYDKSRLLYGWHLAKDSIRNSKYAIIVEGNMDVILAHQTSAKNTVAVSGTALTLDHIKLIKRYTNNVILAFDGDAAGSRAVFRSISLCWQQDMNVKILLLAKDSDPADMIGKDPKSWIEAIKNSRPVMDYYFQRVLAGVDLSRSDHKKIAVNKLLPIVKYLKSKVEQEHYLKLLADKLQLSLEFLKEDMGQVDPFLPAQPAMAIDSAHNQKDSFLLLGENLLAIAFYDKNYFEKLLTELDPEIMHSDLRSLYNKAIVYYTKHQHLDDFIDYPDLEKAEKENWIKLSLLGEKNYQSLPEVQLAADFDNFLTYLKRQNLEQKRQELINRLSQAELAGSLSEQDEISHQINLVNKEIYNLQR
ncbi:MAG: DNA primase [Patescibacteria group bacterium]|nr:DNA primase [Patescibacteria group bacterium]